MLDSQQALDTFVQKRNKGVAIDTSLLEFGYPVSIQSGGVYNLKIGAQPNTEVLSPDTVLVSICTKYKDMCCTCSRTLLIDATPEQKEAYAFLTEVFFNLQKSIRPGVKLGDAYKTCLKLTNDKAA